MEDDDPRAERHASRQRSKVKSTKPHVFRHQSPKEIAANARRFLKAKARKSLETGDIAEIKHLDDIEEIDPDLLTF